MALDAGISLWQPDTLRDRAGEAQLACLRCRCHGRRGLRVDSALQRYWPYPVSAVINVHASLLPRWRGAAPVQRAIEAGDRKNGCEHYGDGARSRHGAGPTASSEVAISGDHTGGTLLAELERVGTQALTVCLTDIASRLLSAQAQDEQQVTYAAKIEKAETAIDWDLGAIEIDRKVRALLPSPGCFTMLNDDRLKVWAAHVLDQAHDAAPGEIVSANHDGLGVACGEGVLVITEAQMPGGKPQSWQHCSTAIKTNSSLARNSPSPATVRMSSARQVAADIIGRVLSGESLNHLLPAAFDQVADGQRPLCQELVYGTLREWPMLQGIINSLIKKPLRRKDNDVLALIGSALYEFTQLSTPKHAVVSETVNTVRLMKKQWASGLVNGVLRSFQRAEPLSGSP